MPARRDFFALTAFAGLVFALDQLTKAVILASIGPGAASNRVNILGSWLALEYTENRGVAFGLFGSAGIWLALVSIVVLGALLRHYATTNAPSLWETLAIGAIVGGAVGNLSDRLRLGYVIDFLSVGAWPNFNVADSAITLGVILLLCGWLLPASVGIEAGIIGRHDGAGSGIRPGRQRAGE